MKKLPVTLLFAFGLTTLALAQDPAKMMVGAGLRSLGPACTNCTALFGVAAFGDYQLTEKIVAGVEIGTAWKTDGAASLNSFSFGVKGDYYFKEAFNGFYLGPDITYITLKEKINGSEVFSTNNLSLGLNAGWAIPIADKFRIIPHFGYGTWYDNSKGKIMFGVKFGYRL